MTQISFEEAFKLFTIDKVRKKKLTIKLVDPDGDEVPIRDTVKQIMKYVMDKLEDKENPTNQMVNQILPLCTQAMVSGLPEVVGEARAARLMTVNASRWPLNLMMLLSFSMLKFIQQKNLKIVTVEQDITDEEYEKMIRLSEVSETATLGAMYGIDPKEILKEFIKEGSLSVDELRTMASKDLVDEITGATDPEEDPSPDEE